MNCIVALYKLHPTVTPNTQSKELRQDLKKNVCHQDIIQLYTHYKMYTCKAGTKFFGLSIKRE